VSFLLYLHFRGRGASNDRRLIACGIECLSVSCACVEQNGLSGSRFHLEWRLDPRHIVLDGSPDFPPRIRRGFRHITLATFFVIFTPLSYTRKALTDRYSGDAVRHGINHHNSVRSLAATRQLWQTAAASSGVMDWTSVHPGFRSCSRRFDSGRPPTSGYQ